ncbi:MAG TPA: glycosyltransferase [Azospirillaceae bacterium]|nr:glycosyltransferase [Azospirillaceae bacterium]
MPRLIVLAPTLSAHHHGALVTLADSAHRSGWDVDVVTSPEDPDARMPAHVRVTRALSSPYERPFDDPVAEIGASNYIFYSQLKGLGDLLHGGAQDLIYLPMLHHRIVYGFMRAYDELLAAKGTAPDFTATLYSQECFFRGTEEIHQRNSAIYARFFEWANGHGPRCRHLFSFAAAHLPHLRSLGAPDDRLSAFPFLQPHIPEVRRRPDNLPMGRVTYGYFGFSWWEQKGLGKLLGAARKVLAADPGAAFLVHVDVSRAAYDAAAMLEAHQDVLRHPRVRVLEGNLPADLFYGALEACDVVVLPYGPAYDRQESGIVHEGAMFGKPVVVPATSVANRRLVDAGARLPAFAEWTPDAIADACLEAGRDLDRYRQSIRQAEPRLNEILKPDYLLGKMGIRPAS